VERSREFGIGWELDWTNPYGKRTLGVGGDFLGFWPGWNPKAPASGKTPGRGRREGWGGVYGEKTNPQNAQRKGFNCLLRKKLGKYK